MAKHILEIPRPLNQTKTDKGLQNCIYRNMTADEKAQYYLDYQYRCDLSDIGYSDRLGVNEIDYPQVLKCKT